MRLWRGSSWPGTVTTLTCSRWFNTTTNPLRFGGSSRPKGTCNQERFAALLTNIREWNLFLAFNIIDGCTEGKDREPLRWLFTQVSGKASSDFTAADIL